MRRWEVKLKLKDGSTFLWKSPKILAGEALQRAIIELVMSGGDDRQIVGVVVKLIA